MVHLNDYEEERLFTNPNNAVFVFWQTAVAVPTLHLLGHLVAADPTTSSSVNPCRASLGTTSVVERTTEE